MAIDVIAWPPVGAVGCEWTAHQPVARLRSALTGRDQMQGSQRKRRLATLQVSALSAGRMGAGYCEMLKDLLVGGVHAVRLRSSPINWHLDEDGRAAVLNSFPIGWRTAANPLGWQTVAGQPLIWFDGRVITASGASVASGRWHNLTLTGLPGITLVARPGDFIRAYQISNPDMWQVARVVRPAVTNGAGTVTLCLDRAITIPGARVNVAGQDEAVFRVEGALPRAVQPVGQNWTYTWNFREVFADEVGGFIEVDPWT